MPRVGGSSVERVHRVHVFGVLRTRLRPVL